MSAIEMPVREGSVIAADIKLSPWESFEHETAFECRVILLPEAEDGGYSAHCVNLPGVISQGETAQEAIENIIEAFRETVLHYREAKATIPWKLVIVDRLPGAKEVSVVVRM
jgi:predicted RNase H-like HicB family nuclease